jgi:hypothetical protein
MPASAAWADFPAGYAPFQAVCLDHPSRVLVRRGAALMHDDGFVDIRWQPLDGGPPVPAGMIYADGGTKFRLRCPRCGRAPEARQEKLAVLLQALAKAGQTDRKGRLVLDIGYLA